MKLKILKALFQDPKSIGKVIDKETEMKQYVNKKHGIDIGIPTIDLLELFPSFNETVMPYSFLEGTSPPLDIAVLKALARRYEKCNFLEIGSWRGESVANVADIADYSVSVSLSDEEMRDFGFSNEFIKVNRFFSHSNENIKHIGHNSHIFDYSSLKSKFDLIFIDGDHSYEGVKKDTQNAFKLLKDDNSIIVWHDYGFTPENVRWSVLAGILDGCPTEKRKKIYHISNTLCAIYINEKFNTTITSFPQEPKINFKIHISASKIK